MSAQPNRIVKAALAAVAAAMLVAVTNPTRAIDHKVSDAITDVAQLTVGVAHVADRGVARVVRHA